MEYPKTLQQAIKFFSDEQTCINAVAEMRWPDGEIVCEGCGEVGNTIWLANQKRWKCRGCKKQFSVKQGTIFHDSPLGLDKWFVAMWMLANCKNGVSSHELSRTIGITQKSAWHMLHRIRKAMEDQDNDQLGGDGKIVEADETFQGGKVKNMHKSRQPVGTGYSGRATGGMVKTLVFGMLERGGKVRAQVVADRKGLTLKNIVDTHVATGTQVITDEWGAYRSLEHAREVINHANEYVRGHVHTNGIENFWSCLKRGLQGTYIAVEPFHLDRYVAEQVCRFNTRKGNDDASRFRTLLGDVFGRQLTFAELTGRAGSAA